MTKLKRDMYQVYRRELFYEYKGEGEVAVHFLFLFLFCCGPIFFKTRPTRTACGGIAAESGLHEPRPGARFITAMDAGADAVTSRWSAALDLANERAFGGVPLRPLQRAAIEASATGRDVLLIMPTGGGKSRTFQLAALATPGLTVVVVPLLALMRDQLEALAQTSIRALHLSSSQPAAEAQEVINELRSRAACPVGPGLESGLDEAAAAKLLFVTPERLVQSPALRGALGALAHAGEATHQAQLVTTIGLF